MNSLLNKLIALVALLPCSLFAADIPISGLPAATTVSGSDIVPIVQSGTTKKATFTVQQSLWDTFYQPKDADLTALAALTGTHTIYYRSAANTWTAVTIGSGLDFTGATLSATGAGSAPNDAHYLTNQSESGLTNEVNLGALTTGVLKGTVSGSVSTISSLADTTVGRNFLTLTNPSAITFTRINADNTVDALNASDFRTAIGAGTGGGDVSSNTATSVDSEIALFNSTTGKSIKRATTTGILKGTSGVISAATSGTDYAPATSGSSILYGNGSGGFSNVTVGTGLDFTTGTLSATGGSGGAWGGSITTHGDSDYTILSTDKIVYTSAAFTTTRTWTLPVASAVSAGYAITIADAFGGITSSNRLKIQKSGSDLIFPPNNSIYEMTDLYQGVTLVSDGTSKWYVVGFEPGKTTTGTFPMQWWQGGVWGASPYTLPTSIGSNGKILQSNGTNAIFSGVTWPTSSAGSGKIIRDNGTNFVETTAAYPDTSGTSGNVLTSDGTNWISSAPSSPGTTSKVSGSDFTTTSASLVDITGLTFAASTNQLYEVDALLRVSSSDGSGLKVGVAYSAAGSTATVLVWGGTSASAAGSSVELETENGLTSGTLANDATVIKTVRLKGWLKTGANAGNFTVKALKLTSGTATVYIGSRLTVSQ